jgi:hypothetical protein
VVSFENFTPLRAIIASQTPTASRQVSRFFRVWWLHESLRRANHPAYFGLANIICANPFGHRPECSLGYAPANDFCEEAVNVETCTTTIRARPPLSRFLTPASSRNAAGFFGSGYSPGRPDRASRLAYFGLTKFWESICNLSTANKPFRSHDNLRFDRYR